MTVADVLRAGAARLEAAGVPDAVRDAQRLMAHVLGATAGLSIYLRDEIAADKVAAFDAAIARRATREPVSHILGYREFWGRRFEVGPAVLDPRPETETLIAAALDGPTPATVWDLGTGSGCILVTLLAEWPTAHGIGADISEAALTVARRNAAQHLTGRATFTLSNWFDALDGQADLIVSNPPYISAQEMAELSPELGFEPQLALTPGGDGLEPYRTIAQGLRAHLAVGGRAFFEIGYAQGADVSAIFRQAGFDHVSVLTDLDGKDRVVSVQ